MNILIIGMGKLGQTLAQKLWSLNHKVWGWKRTLPQEKPSYMSLSSVDVSKTITINPVTSFDAIIYMAAPSQYSEKLYKDTYYSGVSNVLTWTKQHSLNPKFIFISSTGVYGQTQGEPVTETSETKPLTYSGKILLEAENKVNRSPFISSCIRFGGIYDQERIGAFSFCLSNLDYIQSKKYLNLIHTDDCVGIIVFILFQKTIDSCYIGVDDFPTKRGEIKKWFQESKTPIAERTKSNRSLKGSVIANKNCSNKKIKSLGYKFIYPSFKKTFMKSKK